jgi:integrase
MASIHKIPTGWQVRYKTPERRSRKKNFTRKPDALRFKTSVEHSVFSGSYVDPAAGKVTVGACAERWSKAQLWRPSTEVRMQGILANHILPAFGDRPLSSPRRSEVEAWVKGLSATMKPGTVGGIYRVLASLYLAAVRDRLVAQSPCVGIALPKAHKRLVVPLTLEQVDAAAAAIGDRYRPLVILGAGAGLRIGEALGMDVSSIDFLRRQLSVTTQAVTVRKVTTLEVPKTVASVRTVPLADSVLSELSAYVTPGARGLLVPGDGGGPIPQNRFSATWARAVTRAGLPKGTRFHDLRHTFASALIASGCSVKAVQLALGHENASVTLNTYAHLWPSDDERTRSAIEAFMRPEAEGVGVLLGSQPGT